MIGCEVTQRVCRALADIYEHPGFKIEYCEQWTADRGERVPRNTISRTLRGEMRRMKSDTARQLAAFIQIHSKGKYQVVALLGEKVVNWRGANLVNVNLSGEDLSHYRFGLADLQGANLSGCFGVDVEFKGANLDDADLSGVNTQGWDLLSASLQGGNLSGVRIAGNFCGTNLYGAQMINIDWRRGGAGSRGIIMPEKIDFSGWKWGNDNHFVLAKVLEQAYPEDPVISNFIDYMLAQTLRYAHPTQFPCWEGGIRKLRTEYAHRAENIFSAWAKFPDMHIVERWQLGELMVDNPTYESRLKLRDHPLYQLFKTPIELGIKAVMEREQASMQAA